MHKTAILIFLLFCMGFAGSKQEEEPLAFALEREVGRMAKGNTLWPGYEPLAIPLAVFDGKNTYLFRHAAPPEKFRELQGTHVFEGRHPAVVANSSAQIGGVQTATVFLEPASSTKTRRSGASKRRRFFWSRRRP
jgi:hypothetical protein